MNSTVSLHIKAETPIEAQIHNTPSRYSFAAVGIGGPGHAVDIYGDPDDFERLAAAAITAANLLRAAKAEDAA